MLLLMTDADVGRETVRGYVLLLSTNLSTLGSNNSIFIFCIQIKMPMTKNDFKDLKIKQFT